jgi:hypothetical protein
MKSFEELFCEAHGCSAAQFQPKVFWRCLTWRGKLFAIFLGGSTGEHFGPDRTFITGAGRATDMAQIRTEIRDYFEDPLNRGWLRQVADIRVSTRRVRNLARRYLPESATGSLAPMENVDSTTPLVAGRQKAS